MVLPEWSLRPVHLKVSPRCYNKYSNLFAVMMCAGTANRKVSGYSVENAAKGIAEAYWREVGNVRERE
jgi:hypothetical protein